MSKIGYCYKCDKQVEIRGDNFSCSKCRGAFTELFELKDKAASTSRHGHVFQAIETDLNVDILVRFGKRRHATSSDTETVAPKKAKPVQGVGEANKENDAEIVSESSIKE